MKVISWSAMSGRWKVRTRIFDPVPLILCLGFICEKKSMERQKSIWHILQKQNPERKRKQAVICSKTNRVGEAYKAYEELLFSGYQMMNMVFQKPLHAGYGGWRQGKGAYAGGKTAVLAGGLIRENIMRLPAGLIWRRRRKDADTVIDTMEEMMANVGTMGEFCRSPLMNMWHSGNYDQNFLRI